MRSEGHWKNCSLKETSALYNVDEKEKNPQVEEIKVLERDQNGRAIEVYVKGKGNFLISSRDCVYRFEKFEN